MKLPFDIKKLVSRLASFIGYSAMVAMIGWWFYSMSFFFIDGMRIEEACRTTGHFTLLSIGTFECKPVELIGSFNQYMPKK